MTTSNEIDVREKRAELLALWERMFKLCELQVSKMEGGTLDLTASMLKELNAFMKASASTLVELEKAQEQDREKELQEVTETPVEDDEEDCNPMPFPARGVYQDAFQDVSEPADKEDNPLAAPLRF